jgi:quercetin dioxygenase-like cupin family protein
MPLIDNASVTPVEMLSGVYRKTLTDGSRMMLCEVALNANAVVPMHTHPHEQTGYLARGRLRLTIGNDVRDLSPGDAWMIPGDVPHEAVALEKSLLVDIFSPPRDEYR